MEDFMRHVDFSPLYRSTVGFDRLFNLLDNRNLGDQAQSYPPYKYRADWRQHLSHHDGCRRI